jgi:integrase
LAPKRTDASADDTDAGPDHSEKDCDMAAETMTGSLGRTPARRTPTLAHLDADALSAADVAQVLHYAEAASAANTRVAYDADWRAFVAWCAERDATPLPCPPGLLCAYLSSLAKTGLRPSTIGRRASGIGHVHRQHGCEPPTNAEAVKAVLRGIRRALGKARQTKTPATHDLISKMMAACPASLIGIRDRALLALGFAGAFRRSELVALDMADLTEMPDGLRVLIRTSKTDPDGAGQEVAIPRGHHIRPVETLRAWLTAAGITAGPVFRQVTQTGRVSDVALGDDGYVKAIKRRAAAAGLDPAGFSGHSLRAGFLTSASEHGAAVFKLQEVSRHKSVDVLSGYVRRSDLFKGHAGSGFL